MPIIEQRFRYLFGVLFAIFVFFGTSMTIVGATLPQILGDFHWDYVTAGAVLAAGAIAYFMSTFFAGIIVKHLGPRLTILLGLCLDIVGLAFFAASPSPWTNLLMNALIGLGQGCFEVTINWSMLRIDKTSSGKAMNLMHGAFAVGAIAGPLVLGLLIKAGASWVLLYRGMAVLFALIAILVIFAPFGAISKDADEEKHAAPIKLLRRPAYWFSFITLFLYVGVELGTSNWVAEYFARVFAFGPAVASFLVSLFWAGLLAGRFGVPIFYKGTIKPGAIFIFSLVVTASIALLAVLGFVGGPLAAGLGVIAVFAAGLGCSIIYPVVITLIGACFPEAQGRAIGFAAAGGGIGSFLFPFVMAALSQAWGLKLGFATYGLFAVLMCVSVVALISSSRKEIAKKSS